MKPDEYDVFFQGCHSNIEAPLIGRIYKPVCYGCKNLLEPENPFHPNTCRIFGKLPKEYWDSENGECPHKCTGVPLKTSGADDVSGWKSEFATQILIRGKEYFINGNVVTPQHRGDTFLGIVHKDWDYFVEIDVINGLVEHMRCSCSRGASGKKCKHMAAVLFAIEANEYSD